MRKPQAWAGRSTDLSAGWERNCCDVVVDVDVVVDGSPCCLFEEIS